MKTLGEGIINLVLDGVKEEKREEKNNWIAAARRDFLPSFRGPCVVCGKHRSISHAHHIVPLASQFDRGFLSRTIDTSGYALITMPSFTPSSTAERPYNSQERRRLT